MGALLALILLLGACRREAEVPTVHEKEQTILMLMPWSGNLTSALWQNVRDMSTAVAEGYADQSHVMVCFFTDQEDAVLFRLYRRGELCCADTLVHYRQVDQTKAEVLAEMLQDVRVHAPARRYGLVIGSHGTAWIPSADTEPFRGVASKVKGMPQTRWFGAFNEQSRVDISTLAHAMDIAGWQTEFLLFDDCYMSSVEVAYELSGYTHYLIGCPTEILSYGMPYHLCAPHLLGVPDYEQLCQAFLQFYTSKSIPCGTIAVTDCSQLEALADAVAEIERISSSDIDPDSIQCLDGFTQGVFYDLSDYVCHLTSDSLLLDDFHRIMSSAVPNKAATPNFYSAYNGFNTLRVCSGLNTSAPSRSPHAATWSETLWALRTKPVRESRDVSGE
ncbi:MAG: hypothetical protein IJ680_05180 [Paludibacteraceae bacterium]|nr:hypothetical protein [Paludibacteraceae bacterium]